MTALASLCLSIATALVALASLISVLKYKVDRHDRDEENTAKKVDQIIADLNKLIADLRVLTGEQSVINKFSATTMTSLERRLEEHSKILNDHAACFNLLNELLKKEIFKDIHAE